MSHYLLYVHHFWPLCWEMLFPWVISLTLACVTGSNPNWTESFCIALQLRWTHSTAAVTSKRCVFEQIRSLLGHDIESRNSPESPAVRGIVVCCVLTACLSWNSACCISVYMANVLWLFTRSDRHLSIPDSTHNPLSFPVGKVLPKGRTVPGFSESPCTWELAVFICSKESPYPPPPGNRRKERGMIVTKHISFQPVLRQGIPRIPVDPGYHQLLRSDGSFDSAAHLEKSNHTKSDGD